MRRQEPCRKSIGAFPRREKIVGYVDIAAVVGLQEGEFDRFGRIFREKVGKQKAVAQRLAHFLSVDFDEPVVYPVFCKTFARERFGLRDFVLVVREDEVAPAAVYVNLFAERLHIHCGAFDVPTGSAVAPGGLPEGFAFFCGFPKREVEGIAFVFLVFYSHAFAGVVEVSARQFAVTGEAVDGEINVAFGGGVGVSFLDKAGDKPDNPVHCASGFKPDVGVVNLQRAHFLVDFSIIISAYLSAGIPVS